jgi:replication fork protection complex subunit Csm3/Swi3
LHLLRLFSWLTLLRLLSDKGIPKLRKMGPRLRFKGKGHEFDDAGRLLSFYQVWLDDLFPKANFLDALAMVEKAGHKTTMRNARMQWIDEGKPRAAAEEDDEDNRIYQGASGPQQPDKVAAIFENTATAARERAKTPTMDDLFGDDDIYNATPLRNTGSTAPSRQAVDNDIPDDDDLDALIAEAETGPGARTQQSIPSRSIFGNGSGSMQSGPTGEPDDDELDALMAEAEANTAPARPSQPMGGSIFGDGKAKQPVTSGADEEDDLDALMAEAETASVERPQKEGSKATSGGADTGQLASFEDDEEAMAEMDGLW